MSVPVLFVDAEALLTAHLRTELAAAGATVHVGTEVPDPRGEFVLVRRVGGVARNLVTDSPTVAVEVWAASPGAAMDRAQLARAILLALAGQTLDGVQVYRVDEVAGPAPLPDPLSSQPRVTFTVSVALRGTHPTT